MADIEGVYIQGQNVTNIMTYVLNHMACGVYYNSWNNDFCMKENKEALEKAVEELKKIDFYQLTEKEAEILGFRRWGNESSYYVIPIWIYEALPDGIELISIMGNHVIKGKDYVDKDVRFGCLGYGIVIKEPEQDPIYKPSDTIRLDEMEDENE